MKILVLSDSHGTAEYMHSAVKKERPDAIIHLGDHAADADALDREFPLLPLCRVKGNCDFYEERYPTERCIEWEGVKIFATHGHRYGVKGGLLRFQYAAMEKDAQVALFGHTHMPYCENMGELWLLNPGACGGRAPSYGIIEIEDGSVRCCVKDLFLEG